MSSRIPCNHHQTQIQELHLLFGTTYYSLGLKYYKRQKTTIYVVFVFAETLFSKLEQVVQYTDSHYSVYCESLLCAACN